MKTMKEQLSKTIDSKLCNKYIKILIPKKCKLYDGDVVGDKGGHNYRSVAYSYALSQCRPEAESP